jgi:hypothetical protein
VYPHTDTATHTHKIVQKKGEESPCQLVKFYSQSAKRGMLLAQKRYVTGAKEVCYWRKRGMLLAQEKNFSTQFRTFSTIKNFSTSSTSSTSSMTPPIFAGVPCAIIK